MLWDAVAVEYEREVVFKPPPKNGKTAIRTARERKRGGPKIVGKGRGA